MKCLFSFLVLLALALPSLGAIQAGGRSLNGEQITVDLPDSQQMKNVGGSDGLGLCVFTSIQLAARYQNVTELDGFRTWMQTQPGGGYPEKVDQEIATYCKKQGVTPPPYVQHTGGDETFLQLGLKTGRYVCVTYDGADGVHYRGRIAHMVNLVHLSDKAAVIQDNNFPGEYLWMSPQDFLSRWKGMGGGWAIVFLNPPPPPVPSNIPQANMFSLLMTSMLLGQCPGGSCSPSLPLPSVAPSTYWKWIGNSLFWNGEWYANLEDGYLRTLENGVWKTIYTPEGVPGLEPTPVLVGKACKCCEGCSCGKSRAVCEELPPTEEILNYGVDLSKLHEGANKYTKNGKTLNRKEVYKLLEADSVPDDSLKPHLTLVGPPDYLEKVKKDFNSNPLSSWRDKLLIQYYPSSHWMVQEIGLGEGASYQKAVPTTAASAPVEFRLPIGDYSPEALAEAIRKKDPSYDPNKDPNPVKPPVPAPAPPSPSVPPAPTPSSPLIPMAVLGLAGLAAYKALKKKGSN